MKHIYIILVLAFLVSCSEDSPTPVITPDSSIEVQSEVNSWEDGNIVDEQAVDDIASEIEEEIRELDNIEAQVEVQEQQEETSLQAEENPTVQDSAPTESDPVVEEQAQEQKVEVVEEQVVSEPADTRQQRTGSSGY